MRNQEDVILFGFGNTNSGKSYSIFGESKEIGFFGLTYLYLLEHFQSQIKGLSLQAFEIYNEKVYDLHRDPASKEPVTVQKSIFSSDLVLS